MLGNKHFRHSQKKELQLKKYFKIFEMIGHTFFPDFQWYEITNIIMFFLQNCFKKTKKYNMYTSWEKRLRVLPLADK